MIRPGDPDVTKRAITVVVPVYADWASLGQCIESLKAHVDARHRVLLLNDCGPEAESLEHNILAAVQDRPNFAYRRNPRNMGFVKTCNRAVFELDHTDNDVLLLNSDTIVTEGALEEMLQVLYLNDRHGVVTPRSNNATLATVPLRPIDPTTPRGDLEYARRVYDAIRDHLPRYTVVPVGVGFCLLIKRRLIENFGLLDEAFGLGYNEENDFCLRVNRYGYSSVLSNHAFVYHLGNRSFSGEQKEGLERRNSSILAARHGYYSSMVMRYFEEYIDPVDHFADVIARVNPKLKVLINLYHFPLVLAGATKAGIGLLEHLRDRRLDARDVDVTILCQLDAADYHRLDRFGFRLVHPHTIGDEVFHVSYCPLQVFHPENLLIINRHALRSAFAMLDVIALRCQYLLAEDPKRRAIFLDALRLADRVITISEFSKHDTLAYFHASARRFEHKLSTIYPGYPRPALDGDTATAQGRRIRRPTLTDADTFILVFGNDYHHKAIDRTLPYLEKQDVATVILGPHHIRGRSRHIVIAPSGNLPDEEVEALLAHCSLVLVPSQYEGFGLPILEAARYGKPVLYYGSDVGHEIACLARPYVDVEAFETFAELPDKIRRILDRQPVVRPQHVPPLRSLDDYNREVVDLVLDLARQPYSDFEGLRDRWQYFMNVREYYYSQMTPPLAQRIREQMIATLKQHPAVYRTSKQLYRRIWPKKTPGV